MQATFGLVTKQGSTEKIYLILPLSTSAGNHKKTVLTLGYHRSTPSHQHSHCSMDKRVHELLRVNDLPYQCQSGAGNGRHNCEQSTLPQL